MGQVPQVPSRDTAGTHGNPAFIAEIERIIGRRLPDEAGLPTWWSQCPGFGECGEGKAWRVAGMPGHYLIELVRC